MKVIKLTAIITLILLTINTFAVAQIKSSNNLLNEKQMTSNLLDEPLIRIVRTRSEYRRLRRAHPALPAAGTIDFRKNAVVAVYATLPDPCRYLIFEQDGNEVKVKMRNDPLALCAMVMTNVVTIEKVAVKSNEKLDVEFVTGD